MCTDYVREKTQLIHAILEDRQLSNLPRIKQVNLIVVFLRLIMNKT